MRYRLDVLSLFAVLEVLLFGANSLIQAPVAIAEYLFVGYALFRNARVGIMYFVSFSLLSMGAWSYVLDATTPSNFWGLRLFGISLNIAVTFGIVVLCLTMADLPARTWRWSRTTTFLLVFVFYSLCVGGVCVLAAVNHFDNFIADAAVYVTLCCYAFLLSRLELTALTQIVRYGILLTVGTMLLSLVTGISFSYAEGQRFLLMNAFAYVVLIVVFLQTGLYARKLSILLMLVMLLLLASGGVFLGGKTIVILLMAILWGAARSRHRVAVCLLLILAAVLWEPIVTLVVARASAGALVTYKFSQIYDVIAVADLEALSATRTSVGNLIAEGHTIFAYLSHHPFVLLFGKGFGGGVPDVFGYLSPLAGPGAGYRLEDAARNDFVRMHLPMYEVILKAGVIGLGVYGALLVHYFRGRNIFAFVCFVLLATAFSNTKEMLLLTMLCIILADQYETQALGVMGGRELQPNASHSSE